MTLAYDLEVFINLFTATFIDVGNNEKYVFEISERKNDLTELYKFLVKEKHWLVGYNSFYYDSNILAYILNNHSTLVIDNIYNILYNIYNISNILITEDRAKTYTNKFIDIDLMKVGGLFKSLKLVGVSLKWHKLQDLPIDPHSKVKLEDIDKVLEYNLNDVLITKKLYEKLLPEIKMRYDISKKFNINGYTESRSGLANRLLEKFYNETTGIQVKEFKKLRTPRRYIKYSDIILPNVRFVTEPLKKLLNELNNHIYYKDQPFFSKKVRYKGVSYKLGIGGLHSDDPPEKFIADNKIDIVDADVGSYYPSLIIEYNILPQHLDREFLKKYRELKEERIRAKQKKDMVISDALKIVLNSVFGKMLNENHWLYDPAAGLKITLNGQLFLLMLVESLTISGFEVISANTDGIVTLVPKEKRPLYNYICKEWEKKTGMVLEYTEYAKYIRKDVNNYIAIKKDNKVKTKGDFDPTIYIEKGYDKPIVAMALYEYFVNNVQPEQFIVGHNNLLDFCAAYKIDEKFENIHMYVKDGVVYEEKLQRSVRYYVSNTANTLFKRDKTSKRDIRYESEHSVTILNDVHNIHDLSRVNYGYYIAQVRKIINEIEDPQLSLW